MRTIYFAVSAIMATILAGCTALNESVQPAEEETKTAVFTFTPDFGNGTDTKAMSLLPVDPTDADNPSAIKNIFFAVFDAEGFKLAEYAEAVPNTYAPENGVPYTYSVRLTVTDAKRIVHIIANAPESLKYGSEEEVIGSLCTYLDAPETGEFDRQDAYWERIVLENGVHAEPDIALKTDNPAEYERQFAKYKDVVDELSTAKLTRNFASIAVVKNPDLSDDKFLLTGFMLVNVPDRGSIAPYNRNLEKFQQNYGQWQSIADMIGNGTDKGNYQGFTPAGTKIISYNDLTEAELKARMKKPTSENVCEFCYEREVPESNPLYIIIAGKYNGSTAESYYKIDLKDQDDKYFPILRNFHYRVSVQDVTAAGSPSIKDALEGLPSGGNISTSLDLQKLTNISNGEAQLLVSSTEEVIVDIDSENDYVLWYYKFVPDVTHPEITENQPFQLDYNNPEQVAEYHRRIENHLPYLEFTYDPGEWGMANGVMRYLSLTNDGTDGYQCVKFYPNIPGDVAKTSVTTLIGHYYSETAKEWKTITRSLKCTLRKKLEMKLEVVPGKVPNNTNQDIDLRIGFESGLPEAVFSLDFQIESRKRSLSANITEDNHEELPVDSGQSTIPGNNEPAFWFTKTITYEDYTNAPVVSTPDGDFKFFTCHFKTLKPVESDDIYVSNSMFVQNHTSYTMFTAKNFSNLTWSSSNPEVGENLTFSFDLESIPSDGKVMVSMFGVEKASDESNLVYKYSDEDGFEVYEMTVSQLHNTIKVSPYSVGTATIKLDADEFLTKQKDVTVKMAGSQQFNIEANSVNICRIANGVGFGTIPSVSIYYSDPSTGHSHPVKSFAVNTNSRNDQFSIDAVPGSTLYFTVDKDGETYYAQAPVSDLNSATTTNRYNLVFNTIPPKRLIEAQSLQFYSGATGSTAFGSNKAIGVFTSDPASGTAIASITTDNNSRNSEFFIPTDATQLWFTYSDGVNRYQAGPVSATDADNATTGSRYTIRMITDSPTWNLEAGSIKVQRNGTDWGGANVSYYFSDPKTGSPAQIGSFNTENSYTSKNRYCNNAAIAITCPVSTVIYFKATKSGSGSGTYYGSATIEQLDNATTSSRLTLNLKK